MDGDQLSQYCDRCGLPVPAGGTAGHDECRAARVLEPPRYCPECGRRTIVQVTPDGWSSVCSRHGQRASQAGAW